MPWTLYRYILWELLKLLALTTAVLVTVISFAAAIKPLSNGLLGPWAMSKFILFSAPTMLGFALPFAGAFASTLVFMRFAGDNEILACSASGMSYRAILTPVVVLGWTLTMALFLLANFVVPSFYRLASRTVEADLMTVLVSQLNQKQPFDHFRDIVVYADGAKEEPAPHIPGATLQPTKLVQLTHAAGGKIDDEGQLRTVATAEQANILLYHDPDRNESWASIRFHNAMYYDPVRGQMLFTTQYDWPAIRLPSPFRDDPKFLSWPQLTRLNRHPVLYDKVREATEELAGSLEVDRLRQMMLADFGPSSDDHRVTLAGAHPSDTYRIYSPLTRVVGDRLELESVGDDRVSVAYHTQGYSERQLTAVSATIRIAAEDVDTEPVVTLRLHDVRLYDARLPGRYTERSELTLPRMVWPKPVLTPPASQLSGDAMLQLAMSPTYAHSAEVQSAASNVYKRITELWHNIIGQFHERAATAVSCLLLLLLGAVLSMKLKGQMPLVVYFWSFLPAILTIILIHTGEHMASNMRFPLWVGLSVLWSGNVLLAIVSAWVYCVLARN